MKVHRSKGILSGDLEGFTSGRNFAICSPASIFLSVVHISLKTLNEPDEENLFLKRNVCVKIWFLSYDILICAALSVPIYI